MTDNKRQLDIESWNKIAEFNTKNTLMRGEIKTLSDDEIHTLNCLLKAACGVLDNAAELCDKAKKQFLY